MRFDTESEICDEGVRIYTICRNRGDNTTQLPGSQESREGYQ